METIIRNVDDLRRFFKNERKRQELDQTDVAERANVARQTVGNFENGEEIKLSTVFKLIRSLDGEFACRTNPSPDVNPSSPSPSDREFGV